MVQLHMSRRHVESSLKKGMEELDKIYYNLLLEYYYDLESDPRVNSITTLKLHIDKLRVILRWLQEHGIKPEDIDEKTIKRILLYLKLERGLKPSSIQFYVKILRRLLRILGKEELVPKVPYPREKIPPYQLPPPETIEKIIAEAPNLRLQTILALLYETGMRISELLALKGKHVEETPQGYYKLIIEEPKNGEFRIVYVIRYAGLLRQYLIVAKPKPEGYLFPSPTYPDRPIHPRNVEKALKSLGEKYGIKLYPHLLRHLRATLYVKEGLHERIIMKLLGHKTEKMIRRYVNLVHRDIEEAVLKHYGIQPPNKGNGKETIKCPRCGATNPGEANYCWRCGYPLHQQAALELELKEKNIEEKLKKLLEIIKRYPEILKKL